jgi:L-alanine-DL-glutamate epimerase-like enolase superfamily enzyme
MSDRIDRVRLHLLRYPLAGPTGGSGLTAVDVLVVEVADGNDARGVGFSYCLGLGGTVVLAAARELMDKFVVGQSIADPEAFWLKLTAALNRVGRGAHYLAIAAIDVALWDLHAKRLGLPLGLAMGGTARRVPVYGSGGFRPGMSPEQIVDIAQRYADQGISAFKLRAAGNAADAPQMQAIRRRLPASVTLMVDANEKCDTQSATSLAAACADHGALWLEEPVHSYDLEAYRALARRSRVPLATGEHLQGEFEFQSFLAAQLVSYAQPDLAMAGGLTGCLRIARQCAAFNVEVAPHFLPTLFIHLAAAVPCVSWLEDFPLLEQLFGGPRTFEADGMLGLPETPGHGMQIDAEALARYAVSLIGRAT